MTDASERGTPPHPATPGGMDNSAAHYRSLVENIPQRVFYKDLQSRYVAVNSLYANDFGLTPEDMIGRDDYDFHPRALADKYRADDRRVMATGQREEFDEPFILEGREGVAHTVKTPVRDDSGRIIGVCGIFQDVTEQRRLEARLRDSEATLRAIYEHAREGILVASAESRRFIMANPAVCRMLGYSEAELLGMSPEDLHPPEALPHVREHFHAMERGDFSSHRESPFLRKDGDIIQADINATLVSIQGRPCFFGVLRDMTRELQAQEALARGEALLAEAQALAHLGNWNLDLVTGRAEWSDEEYRLLGYAPGMVEAGVEGFLRAVHPDDLAAVQAEMRRAMTPGETRPYHIEHRVIRPDGVHVVEQRGRTVFDAAGHPTRMHGATLDITERKRADEELRQFKTTLDQTQDCVFMFDPVTLRFFYVNRGATEQVGYSAEELLRMTPVDIKPDFDEARFREMIAPMRAAGHSSMSFNTRHRHKDGHDTAVEILLQHIAPAGEPPRFIAIVRDITERNKAEEALRRGEETYARAEAIAHIGSWDWDIVGGGLRWTDEIYRIFGHTPQSFGATYPAFLEAIHPEDRQRVIDAVNASVADAAVPYGVEHRVARPDGTIRLVHERGKVYRDESGTPVRMIGTVHDITDRKAAEEELARYREHLEELVQKRTAEAEKASRRNAIIVGAAMDGFFSAGLDGRVNDCNEAYCRMLGYAREELLGLRISDLEADESPEEMAAHAHRIIERGRDRFDTRHRRKDGGLVHVEANVSVEEIGGERFFFAFVHDITGRKEAEDALIRAKDEAERANRAKSEFLSRMSHELRTPLNAILGFGQLLESDPVHPLAADQRENVREILHGGRHLLEMINEVLDLARIESGKLSVSLEAVAIEPILRECRALVAPLAEARGIRLDSGNAPVRGGVLADRVRLKQVLLNLLSNAVKYNRDGGGVTVSCARRGDTLRLAVTDTGPGLTPEQQALLFRPFERLDADKAAIEGTGIGLALSKRLTELMGGEIGVESAPGLGTTFWVELPAAPIKAAPEPRPLQDVVTPAATGIRTLLYIEDNPANTRLMERILGKMDGLRLITADHPGMGMDLADAHGPDLILLDINLPDMDGYAVLARLRAQARTRAIPVIGISANAMPRDLERAREAGFDNYLTKPLNIEQLQQAIHRALKGKDPET